MGIFDKLFPPKRVQRPITPQNGDIPPQPYTVFTREFDEIITSDDIKDILGPSRDRVNVRFEVATENFSKRFQHERLEIYESSLPLVRKLIARYSQAEREKMVVTFLIDHSGSMRGLKMISALVAVECAISILDQCNIKTEILGFTTAGWQGGRSRKKWQRARSPANPGRLCDLRHVIYKSVDQDLGWHRNLIFALHPDLPKENIDGEALEWAVSRLDKEQWERRAVCFLSDGAPVDDSTLQENLDQRLLVNHLLEAEQAALKDGVDVGYLLLTSKPGYRAFRLSEIGLEPEAAGRGLINLVEKILLPSEDAVTDS